MLETSLFTNTAARLTKIAEALDRQSGWNPSRDLELPALRDELAGLRDGLEHARIAWESSPERSVNRKVGAAFAACSILAALLGHFGLLPGLAGVACGFALRGMLQVRRRIAPMLDAIGRLERRVFVVVEVA